MMFICESALVLRKLLCYPANQGLALFLGAFAQADTGAATAFVNEFNPFRQQSPLDV